ncbi:TonB-dependent receptor [Chitinimonas sp. JJ19]|uniref:TonB-dependent receptor n=1 Tax=Chitinimonas sp. JJ19 TaxID=3109352 RepID=UPI003003423C
MFNERGFAMQYKPTPVALAVAIAMLGAAAPAYAADAPAAQPEVKAEEVKVTGIRASKQRSLVAKRNAASVVEVVTAEDIGKMPDKNVADSLQRVPGVNTITAGGTEGGFGENDRISLRGTPPSLTATTINGHGVGTGDWFILNQTGAGRSVSYSLLPSELVERIEVRKSARADVTEGGVAGSVDIQTRHPLDAKTPFSATANIQAVYSELADKWDPQLSASFNWKNSANTFGIMVQGFNEKRHLRRDGQEFLWWDTLENLWGKNNDVLAAAPELRGKNISLLTGSAWFEQERVRKGGLITLQARPAEGINLELSGFSSKLNASNYNRNQMFWAVSPLTNGVVPSSYTIEGSTVTAIAFPATCPAHLNGACGGSWIQDAIGRKGAYAKSDFLNLDGRFNINDRFTLTGQLGTTRGEGGTPRDTIAEIGGPYVGGSYKLNGMNGAATVTIPGVANFPTAGNIDTWGGKVLTKDSEDYGQVDGRYTFSEGIVPSLKFGLHFAKHERSLEQTGSITDPAGVPRSSLGAVTGSYPSDFGAGLGGGVLGGSWAIPFDQLIAWGDKYKRADRQDWASSYTISEPTSSAYIMADIQTDEGLSGNVGIRFARTKEEIKSYVLDANGSFQGPGNTRYAASVVSSDYTDVLPSANLKLDIGNDLVARIALAKVMARPDFGRLAGLSLNDTSLSGSGGNPYLKPIRSTNFDAGVEWYFGKNAMLSAAFYSMDLSSYVSFGTYNAVFRNGVESQKQGKDIFSTYLMNTPINTTGDVKGLELSLEMPIGGGFGFNTNYTYADGKETSVACEAKEKAGDRHACDLVGTSEHSLNLGGFYEVGKLSARVAYNYRSAFLNGIDRRSAVYQDAVGTWVASLGYTINDNLALSFDAKDINNPLLKTYVYDKTGAKQPQSFYKNGRQYYVGLRMKY